MTALAFGGGIRLGGRAALSLGEGGDALTPAVLAMFAGGEKGVMIDTLSASNLYQDSARTTLVSAIGDPVGGPLDLSPNAKHPVQATAANRPTWDGQAVSLDGSNDGWATPAIDFSGTDKITVVCGVMSNAYPSNQIVMELTANAGTTAGGFYLNGKQFFHEVGVNGNAALSRTFGDIIASRVVLLYVELDISQATAAAEIVVEQDGVLQTGTTTGGTTAGSGNFANAVLYFGRRGGSTLPFNGAIFRPLVIGRLLTAAEKATAKAWVQAAIDARPGFTDTPTTFAESVPAVNEGSFYRTSTFARAVYTTSATVIDAEIYSTMSAATTPLQQPGEGVLIDGAYSRLLPVATGGVTRHRFYLSAGSKTLSFENGHQTDASLDGVPEGTFIKRVWADKALTPALPTPVTPILVYGDSISVGQISAPNAQYAWLLQVRRTISKTIASEGYGGRSLFADAANGTLRAAFVAKLALYNPTTIWIAIGVNDYILNLWTAANFGTAYAALLDDLHVALPSAAIYCQTPIVKTSEVANGLGSTLPNYRTQISNAVSTRTAYATLVDGTTIVTTGDLSDGLHPSTAAQATYAAFFKTTLGL